MAASLWQAYNGRELEDMFLRSEDLRTRLPGGSAIYVWKRLLAPPAQVVGNGVLFSKWLADAVKVPSAKLPRTELAHFLALDGVSLGGSPLTDEKLLTLRDWMTDGPSRRWLVSVLASITDLAPPLYVGESEDLPRRIKEHLAGESDFSGALSRLGLKWADCRLSVCSVPPEFLKADAKSRRTLIELVVARLAIAGSTSRPG